MTALMNIDELCQKSSFKKSTVYYYIKTGILPRATKREGRHFLYDESHISKLNAIRQLKVERGLGLSMIKRLLEKDGTSQGSGFGIPQRPLPPQSVTGNPKAGIARKKSEKRELIMGKAIELFTKKGFTRTKISEITDAVHIGKGTFYLYFKDKLELFNECMVQVATTLHESDLRSEAGDKRDIDQTLYQWAQAFQKMFPQLSGVLLVLRRSLRIDDPKYIIMTRDYLSRLVRPIVKDLRKAAENDSIRETSLNAAAYLLLSAFETVGYTLMLDPDLTFERVIEQYLQIIKYGIMKPEAEKAKNNVLRAVNGEITDCQGTKIRLEDVRFGASRWLPGTIGKSKVRIEPERLTSMSLSSREGSLYTVVLNLKNGDKVSLQVDGEMEVSGDAAPGQLTIPMEEISQIVFES